MDHYMGTLRYAFAHKNIAKLHENIIWLYSTVHIVCAKGLSHHWAAKLQRDLLMIHGYHGICKTISHKNSIDSNMAIKEIPLTLPEHIKL